MAPLKHTVAGVARGSIARELNIQKGDKLVSVNGEPVRDVFDYRFLIADEFVTLEIENALGETCIYEIEKDFDEDIGLEFSSSLMDEYTRCQNNCIFCFVDQMPKGMRETLYFKDDDSRLSFLQGNYVTLTNMKDSDIERIIRYHMEPINISVHTTNPELRVKMLRNRFAGKALGYIDRLYEAGIRMNAQIVLCPGINDKEELERTIEDLARYAPVMESVSVVPVGLTRFREGLYPLLPVTKEDAGRCIDIIEGFQRRFFENFSLHFIHASDEFYLLAKRELPEEEKYDDYPQLENGVGMARLLKEEFEKAFKKAKKERFKPKKRHITVVTGTLAADEIRALALLYTGEFGGQIDVRPIRNDFFGEQITVSGLICGCDLIGQLEGKPCGEEVLIPVNMLRSGENYFLDDVTINEAAAKLKTKITAVPSSGKALFRAFAGLKNTDFGRQVYEQADSGYSRET